MDADNIKRLHEFERDADYHRLDAKVGRHSRERMAARRPPPEHLCPACQSKVSLGFNVRENCSEAWCNNLLCPANDGAQGKTEPEAVNQLSKLYKPKSNLNRRGND